MPVGECYSSALTVAFKQVLLGTFDFVILSEQKRV